MQSPHMYEVTVSWNNGETEVRRVLAMNEALAERKVTSESKNKGAYYNSLKSRVELIKQKM